MRTFEGIDITEDFVDDLVDEWHDNDMPTSLWQFIRLNTGWTDDEVEEWAIHGTIPQ